MGRAPGQSVQRVVRAPGQSVQRVVRRESGTRKGLCELLEKQTAELSAVDDELGEDSLQIVYAKMLRALCSQLGLGLGAGNGIISVFFPLC